jgi:hypothetical protein
MVGVQAFGLTHVVFLPGDRLGELLALVSLLPIFLVVALATSCAVRRELATFTFLFGIIANEVLSYMLKHYFRHERPLGMVVGIGNAVQSVQPVND